MTYMNWMPLSWLLSFLCLVSVGYLVDEHSAPFTLLLRTYTDTGMSHLLVLLRPDKRPEVDNYTQHGNLCP